MPRSKALRWNKGLIEISQKRQIAVDSTNKTQTVEGSYLLILFTRHWVRKPAKLISVNIENLRRLVKSIHEYQ